MTLQPTPLPQLIRSAREAAGLSFAGLAARMGVTEMAVRSWESGAAKPHALRMPILAKVLKIERAEMDAAASNDNGEAA